MPKPLEALNANTVALSLKKPSEGTSLKLKHSSLAALLTGLLSETCKVETHWVVF